MALVCIVCRMSIFHPSAECHLNRIYGPTSTSISIAHYSTLYTQHIQPKFNATLLHQLDSFKSFWIPALPLWIVDTWLKLTECWCDNASTHTMIENTNNNIVRVSMWLHIENHLWTNCFILGYFTHTQCEIEFWEWWKEESEREITNRRWHVLHV